MSGPRLYLLRFAVAVVCLIGSIAASAEESITRFVSELTVRPDASVAVTETISVNVEGLQIKRGILRDFPARYKTPTGQDYTLEFSAVSVMRHSHGRHRGFQPDTR